MTTISIITATYNASSTVADCLRSVASQAYPAEHIVIDGASTDNTLEIVLASNSGQSTTAKILCEPDTGIYDAMNKGITMATGEVIGILNADDFYASTLVLEKVARLFEDPEVMSCYGDLEYVRDRSGREVQYSGFRGLDSTLNIEQGTLNCFSVIRYWVSGPFNPDSFYWGWMPPHPTFFVRKSVYQNFGMFRLDIGSAADYELMLRLLLKERITCDYIPEVLVRMRAGGASNVSLMARLRANRMDRRAWVVNGMKPYPWTIPMKPLRKVLQYVFRK
jgi:glycosyltransferase